MEQIPNESITAQGTGSPEVKPKHAGGRKPKGYYERGVQDKLDHSASKAVDILDNHIEQRRGQKKLKTSLQRACEYVIDHSIGKAKQKIEHSGGILTYDQISKSATELDKHPRPILADVMEIANKYDRDHQEPKADGNDEKS